MRERKRELPISYETAENEIESFLDYYEIYPEEITDEEQKDNIVGALESIIGHIRAGHVKVEETEDGDINIIQKLKLNKGDLDTAKYESARIPTAKVQMKNAKNDDGYGKMYALMGSLCGNGSPWVKNLKGVDYRVMEALSVLFLQCTSG